jgi:hypothetical protein
MADQETAATWTCARCTVTASWTPSTKDHRLPSGWIEQQDGVAYCLSCRRELASEAGIAAAEANGNGTEANRHQAGTAARIEFEVERDPNRADTKIARAASSSVPAVRKVRDKLGLYPTGPS